MTKALDTQEQTAEPVSDNTQAFRHLYGRLNWKQQREEQKAFNDHHQITPGGFRARLAGTVRVSDTELFWFEKRVNSYFTEAVAAQ